MSNIVNKDQIKAYLGIATGTTTWDTLLTTIAGYVCSFVETYCDRIFDATTYTDEEYDGDGTDEIILREYPIISITSVKINNEVIDESCYKNNEKSGIYKNEGILRRIDGGIFAIGKQNIKITYRAGYETIPADINLVATQMASDIFNESLASGGSPKIISQERIGNYSVSYAVGNNLAGGLSDIYLAVLNRYKRLK